MAKVKPIFIYPVSYKRCNILYLCYDANILKFREVYFNSIYYTSQNESNVSGLHSKDQNIEQKLKVFYTKMSAYTYKGKPTKRSLIIQKLMNQKEIIDELRFANIDKLLAKYAFWKPLGFKL